LALAICREVIEQLEKAQEHMPLMQVEISFLRFLKSRVLGLSAIHKSKTRQRSRLVWMKFGDANTKYFHLMANARRKKNHIASLQTENGLPISQRDKHSTIHDHCIQHIGTYALRHCKLNFSALGW
jgi:hypothetical protein